MSCFVIEGLWRHRIDKRTGITGSALPFYLSYHAEGDRRAGTSNEIQDNSTPPPTHTHSFVDQIVYLRCASRFVQDTNCPAIFTGPTSKNSILFCMPDF
jgi:hypothetical protein